MILLLVKRQRIVTKLELPNLVKRNRKWKSVNTLVREKLEQLRIWKWGRKEKMNHLLIQGLRPLGVSNLEAVRWHSTWVMKSRACCRGLHLLVQVLHKRAQWWEDLSTIPDASQKCKESTKATGKYFNSSDKLSQVLALTLNGVSTK